MNEEACEAQENEGGDWRTNGVVLDSDGEIHDSLFPTCRACFTGYPKLHNGCPKGQGLIHAAERIDVDAGGEQRYLYTRCDRCNKLGLIKPTPKEGHEGEN